MKPKEFFRRWGEGIKAITPMQQTRINLMGNILIVIGVLIGLYATATTHVWWLFTILIGSLFITSMALLSTIQRYYALKAFSSHLQILRKEV